MNAPSFRFHWRALLRHGQVLEERDPNGRSQSFADLEGQDVARLALVETAADAEVVALDTATGVFHVLGRRLEFALDGARLTAREGVSYDDVTQFKAAHATWSADRGASGTFVDAHHVGFRAVLPEGRLEVTVGVAVADGKVLVDARFFPKVPGSAGPRGCAVAVLVDGRPWADAGRVSCPR